MLAGKPADGYEMSDKRGGADRGKYTRKLRVHCLLALTAALRAEGVTVPVLSSPDKR
jgi:hypothetical protein